MIEKYFNLKGKHALITGSTRGIGNALAKGLIDAGCSIWIHGRNEDKCKEVAQELGCFYVSADLSKKDSAIKILKKIKSETDHLDILINNAGIEKANLFEDYDEALFDQVFQINVKSVMSVTHALLPLLKKSKAASIVNITSIHQKVPYPKNSNYCMSKAAIGMLSKCLSIELAPYNIRVNNFAPGAVRTEINKEIVDSMAEDFKKWIPAGRVADVSEMIGTALYLCSDASSYTTGATLYVDGGLKEHLINY